MMHSISSTQDKISVAKHVKNFLLALKISGHFAKNSYWYKYSNNSFKKQINTLFFVHA